MENLKGYNIVLVSNTVKSRSGYGGDVISLWENHTPNTLTARLKILSAEHGVEISEIDVVER